MHRIKSLLIRKKHDGFTLLEVLLVVAIIAILAGIVILAINPNKQLGDSRNAQRSADVNTILNAVYQYQIDNSGSLPAVGTGVAIPTSPTAAVEICKNPGGTCTTTVDIGTSLVNGSTKYLTAIPIDPKCVGCNADGTGYKIQKDTGTPARITVDASLSAENGKTISVTR